MQIRTECCVAKFFLSLARIFSRIFIWSKKLGADLIAIHDYISTYHTQRLKPAVRLILLRTNYD